MCGMIDRRGVAYNIRNARETDTFIKCDNNGNQQ